MGLFVKMVAALLLAISHVQSTRVSISEILQTDTDQVNNETVSHDGLPCTGTPLFKSFFEEEANVTGSDQVPSGQDILASSYCRGTKSLGSVHAQIFFRGRTKRDDIHFPPSGSKAKVNSYSFKNGDGIVAQWSGESYVDIETWLPFLGGEHRKPVTVMSNPSATALGGANDYMWTGLVKKGLGKTVENLFEEMCDGVTDDKTSHKYFMEMSYKDRSATHGRKSSLTKHSESDGIEYFEHSETASETKFGSFAKTSAHFNRGLLVLQYKCSCTLMGCRLGAAAATPSLGELRVQKMAIYLRA